MLIEINEILKVLPHRYPFIMIDKVLELTDEKIVAIKNVTLMNITLVVISRTSYNAWCLNDRSISASGWCLCIAILWKQFERIYAFLMGVDKVKFMKKCHSWNNINISCKPYKKKK